MIWSQQLRKLLYLRRYFAILMILLGVVMGVFGQRILGSVARTCPEPPRYREDVPAEIRAELDFLFEHGLLYCGQLSAEQAFLSEPVYWGSEGTKSILFFQPDIQRGVGVRSIAFFQKYVPPPLGDSPMPGFKPLVAGQPVYRNQAPEGASYYYLETGPPADSDYSVVVTFRGPAAENQGLTGRNFWRDLNRLMAWVRRRSAPAVRRTIQRSLSIPILPDRWQDYRARQVNPELAGEDGQASFAVISKAVVPEPTIYQTVSGPFGSTVWVVGVVTGTRPVLLLVPAGEEAVEPVDSAIWSGAPEAQLLLGEFAFRPLPAETPVEARYWHQSADRQRRPPDYVWTVTFPDWQAEEEQP